MAASATSVLILLNIASLDDSNTYSKLDMTARYPAIRPLGSTVSAEKHRGRLMVLVESPGDEL